MTSRIPFRSLRDASRAIVISLLRRKFPRRKFCCVARPFAPPATIRLKLSPDERGAEGLYCLWCCHGSYKLTDGRLIPSTLRIAAFEDVLCIKRQSTTCKPQRRTHKLQPNTRHIIWALPLASCQITHRYGSPIRGFILLPQLPSSTVEGTYLSLASSRLTPLGLTPHATHHTSAALLSAPSPYHHQTNAALPILPCRAPMAPLWLSLPLPSRYATKLPSLAPFPSRFLFEPSSVSSLARYNIACQSGPSYLPLVLV